MNCHATRAVLDLHAEGRLTPGRTAAVALHLEGCAACRALTAPDRAIWRGSAASTRREDAAAPAAAPGKAASSALKAKLSAAVKAERPALAAPAPSLSLFPRDAAGVAWAAAALALVALVSGWNGAPTQSFDAGDEIAGRLP